MTATTSLPPALAPWASALAALDVEVAVALGPLVRQLDQLVTRNDPGLGAHGPLDGYAGLVRRGTPDRLLISEWALAVEVPAEFLRRASVGELLYLDPAYQTDQVRGRVAVLTDPGPEQLGAGRLVQLAALIVLHRRTTGRGAGLVLGVLGDEPGRWRDGEVARLLPDWIRSRTVAEPNAEQVRRWAETLDDADEMWLLTGPRLARELPGQRRLVSSRECAWDEHGATAVEVSLDGVQVELALPRQDLAIRTLRGAGFRGEAPRITDVAGTTLGPPVFPSAEPRLLARGTGLAELVVATVPAPGRPAGRIRRHHLAGPVIAATTFPGHRLVALIADEDCIRVQVVGKRLARLDRIRLPHNAFGASPESLLAEVAHRPAPLFLASGDLLCHLAGGWWRITSDSDVTPESFLAIGPGHHPDQPRLAYPNRALPVAGAGDADHVAADAMVVLGAGGSAAWFSPCEPRWTVWPGRTAVPFEHDVRMLGLAQVDGQTVLVTASPKGVLVRLIGSDSRRTLTRWSGGTHLPALHPTRPWLAVPRDDGRIEVGDIATNTLLLTIRADE